jgi:hypothetical protein
MKKMTGMEQNALVAILDDLPEEKLVRGQIGTVVELWAPGICEVEFSDNNGRPYAFVAVPEEKLIPIRSAPANHAGSL